MQTVPNNAREPLLQRKLVESCSRTDGPTEYRISHQMSLSSLSVSVAELPKPYEIHDIFCAAKLRTDLPVADLNNLFRRTPISRLQLAGLGITDLWDPNYF